MTLASWPPSSLSRPRLPTSRRQARSWSSRASASRKLCLTDRWDSLSVGTLLAETAGAADTPPGVTTFGTKTNRPSSFVINGILRTDGGKERKDGRMRHAHFARPCLFVFDESLIAGILLYIFVPSRSPFPLRHKFMSGPPFARPRGPTPKSHPRWNEQLGQWENAAGQPRPEATRNERRVEQRAESGRQARSAASHVANAAGQQQRRRAFVNRRRESGHNLARCNSTLFTCEGGATLELCQETSANFGVLGDATCAHCSALLFDAEGVAIPGRRGEVRGRSCCSNGDVVLPPARA